MLRTSQELKDFRSCARSFPYFLANRVQIRDRGGVRFDPWPWQLRLARLWTREKRVAILKARQLGISWMAAAYAVHTAIFEPGALVLLLSQTQPDARELLAKAKFIFERLPAHLRPDQLGRDNVDSLSFPGLQSEIVALPSTEKAGRGRTARLVVADEHAFHQWAEANMAAVQPTMEAGGQFISLSSANGIGNLFADLVSKARQPGSEWHFVFLPYKMRPGRDVTWYERQVESYPRAWMIHQEYPRDADEAFVQTGRPVFQREYLDRHKQACRQPLPRSKWPATLQGFSSDELRIWAPPTTPHRYIAGADVAEGLEHGDYSHLSVFDADMPGRPVEVLSLHGHWAPDEFASRIDAVARIYRGLYGIERNNHGLATILECRRRKTPGLYEERPLLSRQGVEVEPGKLGWTTGPTTKPLMIDDLEQALRLSQIELRDDLNFPELRFYQTFKDGKTGAPSGQWDDRVIALAIAVQMRKYLRPRMERPDPYDGPDTFVSAKTSW